MRTEEGQNRATSRISRQVSYLFLQQTFVLGAQAMQHDRLFLDESYETFVLLFQRGNSVGCVGKVFLKVKTNFVTGSHTCSLSIAVAPDEKLSRIYVAIIINGSFCRYFHTCSNRFHVFWALDSHNASKVENADYVIFIYEGVVS
jgi:hypothetical protein